jgi:erythromycin esterase
MTHRKLVLTLTLVVSTLIGNAQNSTSVDIDSRVLNLERFDETTYNQLDKFFINKSVIGLGEATHGTSEFFKLKGEIIKYLVSKRDFNLIVFEAFFTDSESINHYILGGGGDPYKAIIGMGYYIYYTQEFYDLIEWLKDYNSNKREEEKVKIYGCDMTSPQVTSIKVKEILSVKNLLTMSLSENLDWLINHPVKRQYSKDEIKIIKELADELNSVFESLDKNDHLLQHYNRILQQSFEYLLTNNGYLRANKRNKYMAENALFIQKTLENDSKMIIWGHNAHIARHSAQDKIIPMGKHLFNKLGEFYYPIGFGFNRGGFMALNNKSGKRENITVDNSLEGSSDYHFAKLSVNKFFLDFNKIPVDTKDYDWIFKKTQSRNIGAIYYPNELNRNYRKQVLSENFDAIIFIENSSPVEMLDFKYLK